MGCLLGSGESGGWGTDGKKNVLKYLKNFKPREYIMFSCFNIWVGFYLSLIFWHFGIPHYPNSLCVPSNIFRKVLFIQNSNIESLHLSRIWLGSGNSKISHHAGTIDVPKSMYKTKPRHFTQWKSIRLPLIYLFIYWRQLYEAWYRG